MQLLLKKGPTKKKEDRGRSEEKWFETLTADMKGWKRMRLCLG